MSINNTPNIAEAATVLLHININAYTPKYVRGLHLTPTDSLCALRMHAKQAIQFPARSVSTRSPRYRISQSIHTLSPGSFQPPNPAIIHKGSVMSTRLITTDQVALICESLEGRSCYTRLSSFSRSC